MVLSQARQLKIWGVAFLIIAGAMWLLGDTLLPFLLGAGIAYFLDPVADRLESAGLNRIASTAIIALAGVLLLALTMLLVVPTLIAQIGDLIEAAPGLLFKLQTSAGHWIPGEVPEEGLMNRGFTLMQENLSEVGPQVLESLVASSLAVFDFVILLVLSPVVAFYLLLDWDRMVAVIDGWLPRQHADTIRNLALEIDEVLAGFVRGQVSVCVLLAAFYATALTLIGLPYGFLVGIVAGLLAFIPYIGSMTGGVLSIGIALFVFWSQPLWIVITAAIFGFGQFVEGNVLSPKLVGKSVGLHPVLLILALAVFGKLFGFAGMLVAVPVSASLGVIGRFLIGLYLESPLYTGKHPDGDNG